jgi:hypothetical protein
MADDRLLAIYLNDHLAGSELARGRCRHARDQNLGNEFGGFLEWLLGQIEEDRATLGRVMERVGATPSPVKKAFGVVAERAARLKRNGRLIGYSPLSRLLELEFLSLGVEGKRLLWVMLAELGDARLDEFDFGALSERATEQRVRIENHRIKAGLIAFR